jgi:ankyrin repeat protein
VTDPRAACVCSFRSKVNTMLTRDELISDIRRGVAIFENYVRPGGPVNLTDANVHAEPFVAGLLNHVYGWNLVSTNDNTANYPCIDLIDKSLRLGVQVTSEKGSKKVNDTIDCLEKHKLAGKVRKLKVFSLIKKQDRYSVSAVCPGIVFEWSDDVLDFDDIVKKTVAIVDLQQLARIREYVVASMQSVFSPATGFGLPAGVEATYPHLFTQIRSGNGDNVRRLLQAGLSPNIDWNGERPLRVALELLDHAPASTMDDRRAVVKSLLQASDPPREVAIEAHDAFDNGHFARLVALLMAGLPLDVRNELGTSLLAKAMRRDDGTLNTQSALSTGSVKAVALLFRYGKTAIPEMAGWAFRWACHRGDLDLAKQLSDIEGVRETPKGLPNEVITKDEAPFWRPGVTPLHLAAKSMVPSATRLIEWLLKTGGDDPLEDQDDDGNTTLMVAVSHGSVETVRLFALQPQQNFDVLNKSGESALSLAVGDSEKLQILIQAGARVPKAPHNSPVHAAAYRFDVDCLDVLLASNVDVDVINNFGRTPLLEMCCFGFNRFISEDSKPARAACLKRLLNAGADVRAVDTTGRTALHWLAQTNEVAAIQDVLARNPNVNAIDQDGRTPLMYCLLAQMAEVLLKHGADPGICDKRGDTALARAIMFDLDEVAQRLRAANASADNLINAEFLLASRRGDVPRLEQLLSAGGDPNAIDFWGRCALELAAIYGHVEVVEMLLENGAEPDSRDDDDATPLANVLNSGLLPMMSDIESLKGIAVRLLDAEASLNSVDSRGNSAAHIGVWWWHFPDLTSRLLDACCHAVNLEGTTLVMIAVERGSFEHVRYLVEQKHVDVNQKDRKGQNVLFFLPGWRSDSPDRARFLLDAGADLECTDVDGRTPLLRSAAAGSLELVRMFVNYAAKLDHQDHAGRTARHHALENSKVEIVNFLWECERNPDQRRITF